MPAKKQRVSVLRIPRQSLHQTNSNERQEEIQPDPAKIQLKPQPPPEPNPSVIQVKPRHLPERDPSPPIQIKPRPLPEPDPPIVRVKPRSPPEPDKTPPKKKEHNVGPTEECLNLKKIFLGCFSTKIQCVYT
jgi:DedD protein